MTSYTPFSCYLMGTESLLIQCGAILARAGHEVRGVISADPAITAWATGRGIPVLPFDDTLTERLAASRFDYFLSITNLRMVPETILALPERGAINFHDGPLPHYAGLYTPSWAIMQRDTRYGITWHTMTAGIDTGDILKQRMFDVAEDETALTINTKCFEAAIQSFAELVAELATGRETRQPQDFSGRNYYERTRRPAAAAVLDFERDAADLEALVRALQFGQYPNPLVLPKLMSTDGVLAVVAAEATDAASTSTPGTVVSVDDAGIRIATASTDLLLTRLTTLDGAALIGNEAAAMLGLHVGTQLPVLDSARIDRLTALTERAAKDEPYWVRRLATRAAPAIPYADRSRASSGTRFETARMDPTPNPSPPATPAERGVASASSTGPMPSTSTSPLHSFTDGEGPGVGSLFATYLARICGQHELTLGFSTPELRVDIAGAESLFAATVPVRFTAAEGVSVAEVLAAAERELAGARRRFTYLHDVVARNPQLAALRGVAEGARLPVSVQVVSTLDSYQPAPGTELAFVISEDGSACAWMYDADLYEASAIESMQRQFRAFVQNAAAAPSLTLAQIGILDEDERRRLLFDWNATAAEYPREKAVHHLFEEQAEYTPDAVALVCEDGSLTYAELNERANKLARHLKTFGVGPDVLAGICIERSLDLVVAVLGVHKAGGGYVPLDPVYPRDRIAFMAEDAAVPVLLTQERLRDTLPATDAAIVCVDSDWGMIDIQPGHNLDAAVSPKNLAYVIYTSGSTGKPKGVMIEHWNVVNFFAGMDQRLQGEPPGSWLAVTSLSFDISVLELLWTLCRGFKVVVYTAGAEGTQSSRTSDFRLPTSDSALGFSLFYFSSDQGVSGRDAYRLLLEGAKFADRNGFEAVWTPERHFHAFGGLFPNPSVTSAAIASITERVKIRSGSVVLPLHSPLRVAEEWSVVDNLSDGRVGISFASGWQPNDFVLMPENYADAKGVMVRNIETVRKLWRGEAVEFPGPDGKPVPTSILPRPVQAELPVWVTAAGNPETFRAAGELGAGILTHLLGQSMEEVTEKIGVYRAARRAAGHPGEGHVTLMLHTYVGEDEGAVRELVREPMKEYLRSSVGLIKGFANAFPIFRQRADAAPGGDILSTLSDEEMDALLDHAFLRYYETSGLFGTVEQCAEIVERLRGMGVDEVACLIDFGVATDTVLESLDRLNQVRERAQAGQQIGEGDYSIPALIRRHGITHLQCTPSMATMLVSDPRTREALRSLKQMMVGGEAFPATLAAQLTALVPSVVNMYGPTETTIWSSTHAVVGQPSSVSIGKPLANQQMYILDPSFQPAPVGMPGELFIGGDGVVRGYLNRPELTAERFLDDPFVHGNRMYRTGDLARWMPDGTVDFLGRIDNQVKLRGYRIELGEIENLLAQQPGVREAVVIAREDTPGDKRLVAYLRAEDGSWPAPGDLRAKLAAELPEFMVPGAYVFMDAFPLTPNKKVDRTALPAPGTVAEACPVAEAPAAPPRSDLEAGIAAIWKELLGLPAVGMTDNFFDLGGHSLLIVQLHRRLGDTLDRSLSLTDLFRFPTIRSLAEYLGAEDDASRVAAQGASRADARREMMARRRVGVR